jgi:shikimate kinase
MQLPGSARNLVLVGFMGSGKSSVGREIARRWGYRFLDTDSVIRQRHCKPILEIFESQGEPFFRDQEHLALREMQGSIHCVIATGGGIILQPRNRPLLHALGIIVWLSATEEIIWERVSRNRKRPLLQTADPRATINRLISLRNPLYEAVADITIETSGLTHEEVAARVAAAVSVWAPCQNENDH